MRDIEILNIKQFYMMLDMLVSSEKAILIQKQNYLHLVRMKLPKILKTFLLKKHIRSWG